MVLTRTRCPVRAAHARAVPSLLDGFADTGHADAAADYARQIPVRVTGRILGIPEEMSDTFVEWVRSVLEFAHDAERRNRAQLEAPPTSST